MEYRGGLGLSLDPGVECGCLAGRVFFHTTHHPRTREAAFHSSTGIEASFSSLSPPPPLFDRLYLT